MNRPVMEGLRLNTPATVRHTRLIEWVAQMAA
jgi:phosphoenolpyruvate carboxykinase (GTP)